MLMLTGESADTWIEMNTDINHLIYLPDGKLNAPLILANANLLLKENEINLASSLFLLITKVDAYSFCGFYGLAKCLSQNSRSGEALEFYQKAFQLSRRPYIAVSLIECLIQNGSFQAAERMAFECATEFAKIDEASDRFRKLYEAAVRLSIGHQPRE